MSYLDLTAANAALKEHYDGQAIENLAYDDNPFLAMVPKSTKATGKYIPLPVIYETSQGGSATFSTAQTNQTPGLLAEFLLTLKADYSVATITNQAMLAGQDEKGSFIDLATMYVDLALRRCAQSASSSSFRSGTGSIGLIAAGGITSGVITLSNAADVAQFGVNMTLQANATDGGSPRAALGYVIARDVAAGTITVASSGIGGAAASPASWAAGDYLLVQGDNNAKLSGLSAWLPSTAPAGSDNFYGVNRSVDSRLYGLAYNGVRDSVEEALIDAALLVRREGGRPRHFFTNYGSEAALLKAVGSRREYCDWKGEAEISFRGVLLQGPAGPIEVFSDRSCQAKTGYLVQLPAWKMYSLDAVPHILTYGENQEMLRVSNADASECRTGYYANLGCSAPGWNSQVSLGA